MKIDSSFNNANLPISNKSVNRVGQSSENIGSNVSASSNVQLSEYLQLHEAKAASIVTFNSEKVEQIKAAIADGRYQVNAEAIAETLIATAREILKTQQPIG